MSALALPTVADLSFEEEGHIYRVRGRRVINITSVTDHFGGFGNIPEEHRQRALLFGQYVHKACELDDLGVLDEDSIDPMVARCVAQWRMFKADTGCTILANELKLYHPVYDYAGRLDRAVLLNEKRCILEIKTGAAYRTAGPQTAAQALAAEASGHGQFVARYSVHLGPDRPRYNLVPHIDPHDRQTFLAMLQVYRWLNSGA